MILKSRKNLFKLYLPLLLIFVFAQLKSSAKNDTIVVVSTSYGVIKLKLYDDTPIHKHNFIKLVKSGFYDSLLFHRIISGFMIQGGDPDSKKAGATQNLGNGDIGYTLPAEIFPTHIHKKGALAAARQSDDVNPNKASSGCQFYIVQGKKFSDLDMVTVESRMVNQLKQSITWKYLGKPENTSLKERYMAHQQKRNIDSLNFINKQIQPAIEAELKLNQAHKFSPEEKKIYATVGGSPHLDGNYTVFGEVIEGIDVVDKIAEVEVAGNSRPITDIRMKVTLEVINN
jgi:cyclophilin family peptidyl-prolyl cis-trans isomerase